MTLTPVRIRGKKHNRTAVTNSQKSSTKRHPTSTSTPSKLRKKAIPTMPTLQGLPQELLEIVFLYSMNPALPQSSHDIGRKLSSKAITMAFTTRSFFHTVDHKGPLRNRLFTSSVPLQSSILRCRFFTWQFFLSYVNKARDSLIQLRGRGWGVPVPDARYFLGLFPFKFTKVTYLGFTEGFRVPEKLLHGPWTQDKAALLYVLVSFNGEIDWEGSMAGETAKEGLKEAIRERNECAVAALSVLLGVAQAITTEMLTFAVLSCGCDMNILRHLLFNAQILYQDMSKDVLNFHDPALWQWADERGEVDDRGELLKDMLKKAETFSLEFYRAGETDWSKIVGFPYGGSKFDTRTTFDDLTRELLKRLYRNYGRRITRRGGTLSRSRNNNGGSQVARTREHSGI